MSVNFGKYEVTHYSKRQLFWFLIERYINVHTPKIQKFSKILHKLFFHEFTQLEGVRLKTFKNRSNMEHPIAQLISFSIIH